MNLEEAPKFLNRIKWQYAKTYPQAPHEYSVLNWNGDNRQKFIDFAKLIVEKGQDEYYYNKKFKVLIIGGYKYWTMDYPLENTDLINRTYHDKELIKKIKEYIKSEDFIFEKGMTLFDIRSKLINCKRDSITGSKIHQRKFTDSNSFKKYIDKINKIFVGKTVEEIYIENNNYYDDEDFEFDEKIGKRIFWDKNSNEDVEIKDLETSVTLKISDFFVNIDFYENDNEFRAILSISDTKQGDLLNISHYYSKNIIGNKIEKIYSKDGQDFTLKLENGYEFNIFMYGGYEVYLHEWIPRNRNEVNYNKLKFCRYERYSSLNKYINSVKNQLIGKKIEKIMRLGIIFSYVFEDNYKNVELDEPVDIKIGDYHLNIDFVEESDAFAGINLFDYSETSYFWAGDFSWTSLNPIFKNDIIGQTIKDIVLTRFDKSVYTDKKYAKKFKKKFKAIHIILENGWTLELTNSYDYMHINAISKDYEKTIHIRNLF